MTDLVIAYGLASFAVLAWLAARLARNPRNLPLRAVTGLVAGLAVAFPLGEAADRGVGVFGLPPMASRLLQHGSLLIGVTCLVYFFLFSALDPAAARRRALIYAAVLAVAEAVLIGCTIATPAGVNTNDHSVPGIALFFMTADLYLAFGFGAAFVWTRRYARIAAPRLARGLRLASIGQAAVVLANCVFIPAIALRWIGGSLSPALAAQGSAADTAIGAIAASVLLLPGILLFLIGVTYPAAAMRVAAWRIWVRHRRDYRRIGPLWTALHAEFPDDALSRVPTGRWRDTFTLRGVHRRYYRRVVECRDGLVRASPHLTEVGQTPEILAGQLKQALAAHSRGEPGSTYAVAVAIPAGDGLDADVEELIALARALAATA